MLSGGLFRLFGEGCNLTLNPDEPLHLCTPVICCKLCFVQAEHYCDLKR